MQGRSNHAGDEKKEYRKAQEMIFRWFPACAGSMGWSVHSWHGVNLGGYFQKNNSIFLDPSSMRGYGDVPLLRRSFPWRMKQAAD
jgi:hypothetical protein